MTISYILNEYLKLFFYWMICSSVVDQALKKQIEESPGSHSYLDDEKL